MAEKISEKNTKNQILEAYSELLAKVQEQQQPDRKKETKKKEEEETVEQASGHSVETIVKNLAESKLSIVQALDGLEEQLISEYRKLTGIQQAIEIEKRNLQNVYEISTNADSLAALLLAQQEKQVEFETEMGQKRTALQNEIAEKRDQWKKEQADFEQSNEEKLDEIKKERTREEEEYNYELQLTRKKDTDAYEAQKLALETELEDKQKTFDKELSDREAALSEQEREYEELTAKVSAFPEESESAVEGAKAAVKQELELTYRHQAELTTKEMESEQKLNQQTISALENKIQEQDGLIQQMTRKMDEAGIQVQNIALKAIEGASTQRVVHANQEKSKDEE